MFWKLVLTCAAVTALAGLGAPTAAADDTCQQGFVWREARPGDLVCVTPAVRARTAEENARPFLNAIPGSDTCEPGFVWREAFVGDLVCVTPAIRAEAAQDNAAAASRTVSAPAPKPPAGPGVTWSPRVGGLTASITDRSGVDSQCTYQSDWYTRSFFLQKNTTFDLVIVPAIPKFQNWNVTINCDNGAKTQTSTFF